MCNTGIPEEKANSGQAMGKSTDKGQASLLLLLNLFVTFNIRTLNHSLEIRLKDLLMETSYHQYID